MEEAELWQGYRNLPIKEKGKLREPAQAIAAAKCILYRLGFKGEEMQMHPSPCTMCHIKLERLVPIYEEWMQWSGLNDPPNKHKTLAMFEELPREIQLQEVRKAQGYVKALDHPPDRTNGHDPSAVEEVALDGGNESSGGSQQDHRGAARSRDTGRTHRGVRSDKSKATPSGDATKGSTEPPIHSHG